MTASVQHVSPKTDICQKWNNSDAVSLTESTSTDFYQKLVQLGLTCENLFKAQDTIFLKDGKYIKLMKI